MTSEELQTIKERAEKATAGPWTMDRTREQIKGPRYTICNIAFDVDGRFEPETYAAYKAIGGVADEDTNPFQDEDAAFIAHARSDIPALIAEVERLQALYNELRISVEQSYMDKRQP